MKGLSVSSVYKSAKFPFQFDYGDKDTDGAPGTEGSHGTHVASTAAGCTGINADVQGVAPDAQIANMNVFKSSGGLPTPTSCPHWRIVCCWAWMWPT